MLADAQAMIAFETQLALVQLPDDEQRDYFIQYNAFNMSMVRARWPMLGGWGCLCNKAYLAAMDTYLQSLFSLVPNGYSTLNATGHFVVLFPTNIDAINGLMSTIVSTQCSFS